MIFNVRLHNRCDLKIRLLRVWLNSYEGLSEFCSEDSEGSSCCPLDEKPPEKDERSNFTLLEWPHEIAANSTGLIKVQFEPDASMKPGDVASVWLYVMGREWKTGTCMRGPWVRKALPVYIKLCGQ